MDITTDYAMCTVFKCSSGVSCMAGGRSLFRSVIRARWEHAFAPACKSAPATEVAKSKLRRCASPSTAFQCIDIILLLAVLAQWIRASPLKAKII